MKILESNQIASERISQWVSLLLSESDQDFLEKISVLTDWPWEDLDDLSGLSGIMNRVDSLFLPFHHNSETRSLEILLDFTLLVLTHIQNRALYNSIDELAQLLDNPSWSVVYKTLKVLKVLSSQRVRIKHPDLGHKLYVLGLGSNLNNPSPVSLQDLCSSCPIPRIQFIEASDSNPDSTRFISLNRDRTNSSLDSLPDRPLLVACQLLALSVFLQLYPESSQIQEFCKTLPEIWLLPALSELVRTSQPSSVQVSALSLIGSIIAMLDNSRHESFNSQLAVVAHDTILSWNSLLLCLLRELSAPRGVGSGSGSGSGSGIDLPCAIVDLAGTMSECKHTLDVSHLPAMTCSLLTYLKNVETGEISVCIQLMIKVVRVLSNLVPHALDMFKEVDGFGICVSLCNSQVKVYVKEFDFGVFRPDRGCLIKGLMRVVRIVLGKLEIVPGVDSPESRVLVESGLVNSLKEVFARRRYEVYEEAVIIVTHLVGDNPVIVSELVRNGLILTFIDSLDPFVLPVPCNSKFIEILARLLCLVGYNIDGCQAIEGNPIVSSLLVALGNIDSELISNNIIINIGECLQELTTSIPSMKEKMSEGLILLIQSLHQSISDPSKFFIKISNSGRIFSQIFTTNPDLLKTFISKGGFDKLLDIFKLPVIPKYSNNEFYSLTACLKSLPSVLINSVLAKVIEKVRSYYTRLEDLSGPLSSIEDFGQVKDDNRTGLIHLLTEGDCYLEIIRVILHNWVGISNNHKDFSELLIKLALLLKVLIAEQARLLCSEDWSSLQTTKFNSSFDISVLENQESKTTEENLLFCYQLTIRRIFRLAMKIPNRSRQVAQEEAMISVCNTLGSVFTDSMKVLSLAQMTEQRVYYLCLQLSDIMKVLLHEQGSSPAIVLTFHNQGGTDIFTKFLIELKEKSFELAKCEKLSQHLVNGLQILWHLSGKFLESLVNGKYLNTNYGQQVIKFLGIENSKEVMKKMQIAVLEILEKINFLECGKVSNYFAKSVIEIFKVLSNLTKEKPLIDPKSVKALTDMGFSAGVSRQALISIGSNSIELAMEWIFNHPEANNVQIEPEAPVPNMVHAMHLKLINALPYIPSLYGSVSDLLCKIALINESDQDEIGLILLFLIGKLADELLQETDLKEITSGMAELEDPDFEPSFEQLNAAVQVLQSLCIKIPEILVIVKGNAFLIHATNFLKKADQSNITKSWVPSLFSIIDTLVKSGEVASTEIIPPIISTLTLLSTNPNKIKFTESDLLSLVNLLNTLTFNPVLAKEFIDNDGLKLLLLAQFSKSDSFNKPLHQAWTCLIKQLCEDPYTLQSSYEVSLISAAEKKLPVSTFFKNFKSETERSLEIFNKAFENSCIVVKRQKLQVERKKDRKEINAEKWNSVKILAQVLGEVFEAEQKGVSGMYTSSEKLVNVIADVLQSYPRLIAEFVSCSISLTDRVNGNEVLRPVLSHLVRTIIPFKFLPKLDKEKLTFVYPSSLATVRTEVYQNWIKSAVRLLRINLFKQTYKNPDSPICEVYNSVFLDNNAGVVAARKIVIKEFKEVFCEQMKKNWFDEENSLTLVRCTATLLMQILREPPKLPFMPSGSVELARLLLSDKYNIPKFLSESIRGVNLSFKKSSSVLNLLLAPLELLTKYYLNFALKNYKPSEYSEAPIEVFHESGNSESDEQVEEENEEDEEDEAVNEDLEDSGEVSSESQADHGHLQDIVIESWNTEQFWADDLEEEEQEFPRRAADRNLHMIMAERSLLDQENVQPYLNYRSIFRDLEENLPSGIMWNEFENDDLLQMLLHRNRIIQREESVPEPSLPRVFPDSTDNLLQLSAFYSNLAVDEALIADDDVRVQEEVKNQEEFKNPAEELEENHEIIQNEENLRQDEENLRQNEEAKHVDPAFQSPPSRNYNLPEGIDMAILNELPEDIRNEVLSQYQRPAREDGLNEEFLQALPADIRNEVLAQNRPAARPAPDVDNATFIATLTPELRREVLLGASEEFLNTLPPELVAEARGLQDRYVGRDYFHGRQQVVRKKQVQEEDKTISAISADDKLAASLPVVDDGFLEGLLKILYLATPVNRDILNSLLADLSAQPVNRSKIIDALISLLVVGESKGGLPPGYLFGAESYLENYSKVYAITSIRILDVLLHLVTSNTRVAQDLVALSKHRLPHIKSIKPEDTLAFQDLISLMDHSLFRTSTSHLTPLISLLSSIVQKLDNKIPSLNQITVDRICSLLSFESLNESTVKSVVEIVTKLSSTDINKEQVVQALKTQLTTIGKEILSHLQASQTSSNGLKEVQLLRICKVISGIYTLSDEIDFLWPPLSAFLSHITGQESQLASTTNPLLTRLLPLIECLLISHYTRSSSEAFCAFTETHCKLLNLIIRQNPVLLYETFSSLVSKFPYLLDFENKRVYFKAELRAIRRDKGYENISLRVRRHEVFMDSFHQLKNKTPAEMHGKLRVTIAGEEGLDAGGVSREWYGLLAREMFNVDYALFKLSANGVSFQPNPNSSINSEHIQFFKFIGRIIGKALCDGQSLDIYFTRSFYKHILGQEVTYQDMEDLDVDFYKSLKFLMEINLDESDLHEYYFAYEEEEFGVLKIKELLSGGKTRRVTEADKMDYIKLLCAAKMTKNIQAQIEAFKAGFNEMVPAKIVSIFDSKELELLISGLPTVDLDDLKVNTEYHNYNKDSEVIVWFWDVLESFSREERAEFIQFVTGSSKVPIEGFKALPGIGGFQKFQIHKSFASADRLPTAHTCMNQLDLPEYPTREQLRHLLKLAITEGKEGFGFV